MSLADEVLAERKRTAGNPDFVQLSDEMLALCAVLDRHEQIAAQNQAAAQSTIIKLPKRYADGLEPSITARSKRRKP